MYDLAGSCSDCGDRHRLLQGRYFLAAVMVLCSGLMGCSSDAPPANGVSIRDSAGIQIVESASAAWSTGVPGWELDSIPTVEINGDPEHQEYFLFFVVGAQLLENGYIVVADRGNEQLVVFDSLGGFVETVGRPGEGPGEFSSVLDIFRCVGDTLMVREALRMSVLDSRPRFVRTELIAGRLVESRGVMEGVWPDCSAILINDTPYELPTPGQGIHQQTMVLQWSALDGSRRDTVVVAPGPDLFPAEMVGRLVSQEMAFGKEPVWAVDGELVYFGAAARFEITAFNRNGALQRIIRWDAPLSPVTDADVRDVEEQYRATVAEFPQEAAFRPAPDHFPIPEYKPAYGGLLVDDRGNLWVRLYRENIYEPPPTAAERNWAIIDASGRWLGTIRIPDGLKVLAVQRDLVVGVFADENDVEHVRLYRIRKLG